MFELFFALFMAIVCPAHNHTNPNQNDKHVGVVTADDTGGDKEHYPPPPPPPTQN
jgi:hypothetical protein